MRSIEISARKREDAINKALSELGIERHEAHVEILDEGSPGFLGIGVRDVTVRVSTDVPGEGGFPIEADGNRIDFERQPVRNDRGHSQGRGVRRGPKRDRRNGDRDRGARPQQQGRPAERASRERRDKSPRREQRPERPKNQRSEKSRDSRPRNERSRNDRPRQSRPREDRPRQERPRPEAVNRPPEKVLTDTRSCEAAALLNEIIQGMGIESNVQPLEAAQGGLKLSVQSADSALLIGRKGRNLTALQYLINRIFNRQDEWKQSERIVVDVEGYLDRRRDTLEDMAQRLAERAKSSGRRVRVKPLSPQERRIIHLALHDDPDIRTFSVGESNFRSVIIAPVSEEDVDGERDEGDGYDDANEVDMNGENALHDENDSGDESKDRTETADSTAPAPEEAAPSVAVGDAPEEVSSTDTADPSEDNEEDELDEDADKRFQPRRRVGRRGAVRKRRPAKPLASVAATDEKAGAEETKDDASRDTDSV